MNRKFAWIVLLLFFFSLLLRKTGFGFSSLIINITGFLLCFIIIYTNHFFKKNINKILLSTFLFILIGLLQYWISFNSIGYISLNEGITKFLIFTCWILFSVYTLKEFRINILAITLWLIMTFVFTSFTVLDQRQFHNLFRYRTYEDFIRTKFTINQGPLADYYIDKYKNPEKEKSEFFLNEAINSESNQENEKALTFYNKSIDLNPDNALAYYRRGLLKLTRLDINNDVAISALKDFSRTIRPRSSKRRI